MATWKALNQVTGGLSKPSKMPGFAYSIPAERCITGGKLREVAGSVCSDCYACKGHYAFATVQSALERRYGKVISAADGDGEAWVSAMVESINKAGSRWFRWHDSGDLQSKRHLTLICEVARRTPDVSHWLPTKEYATVKGSKAPPNLTVRLSAHMHDRKPPRNRPGSMTVATEPAPRGVFVCPAPEQGNACGDCRACWDSGVAVVAYVKH